jgi:hypothetical protein
MGICMAVELLLQEVRQQLEGQFGICCLPSSALTAMIVNSKARGTDDEAHHVVAAALSAIGSTSMFGIFAPTTRAMIDFFMNIAASHNKNKSSLVRNALAMFISVTDNQPLISAEDIVEKALSSFHDKFSTLSVQQHPLISDRHRLKQKISSSSLKKRMRADDESDYDDNNNGIDEFIYEIMSKRDC